MSFWVVENNSFHIEKLLHPLSWFSFSEVNGFLFVDNPFKDFFLYDEYRYTNSL